MTTHLHPALRGAANIQKRIHFSRLRAHAHANGNLRPTRIAEAVNVMFQGGVPFSWGK